MLQLAVATDGESFERLRDELEPYGIDVRHLATTERTVALTGDAPDDAFAGLDPDVGYVFPPRWVEGAVADVLLDLEWINDRAAVATSRNKAAVLARCAGADVPVPETVLVSDPVEQEELRRAVERVGPPAVVKPTTTTQGVGVAKVGDVDSALGVADYLDLVHDFRATGDKSFLVQEFLPGARDLRITTIDGEYAGAVERRRPDGGWRNNVHRGATATGIDPPAAYRDLAERVAGLLSIDVLGVDLLVTDDRVVVSETNARPTIDDPSKYEPDFLERLAALVERTATA